MQYLLYMIHLWQSFWRCFLCFVLLIFTQYSFCFGFCAAVYTSRWSNNLSLLTVGLIIDYFISTFHHYTLRQFTSVKSKYNITCHICVFKLHSHMYITFVTWPIFIHFVDFHFHVNSSHNNYNLHTIIASRIVLLLLFAAVTKWFPSLDE